ncbi:MAG TPA: glycosyltransferase family 87 protein [Gaiellales bacterium]|nr:glycosyltransferase family 87 protein [Gaiellales bacterium]
MAATGIRNRSAPFDVAVRAAVTLGGAVLVAVAALACFHLVANSPDRAIDFRTGVWQPAVDILHGSSPYAAGGVLRLQDGVPSIYPPFIALLSIPLGLLSFAVASVMWGAILVVALALTLWVLGVRDWRLYGGVFLLPSVVDAIGLGQVEMLLVLALAVVWRYRDRWLIAALALGAALAVKPLMIPVLAWLLITRRVKASLASVVIALGLALGSWAVIGFEGMRMYPALLQAWDRIYGGCGVSMSALALKLGAPGMLASVLPLAVATGLLVSAWRLSGGLEGDRRSFAAAMCAVVVAAPVVWSHYLVYLIVPLVLAAPRIDWRWLLLAAPWAFGHESSIKMYLAHAGGRVVPTASFVGSNTYPVLIEYLVLTAAIVLVTMRASAARGSPAS